MKNGFPFFLKKNKNYFFLQGRYEHSKTCFSSFFLLNPVCYFPDTWKTKTSFQDNPSAFEQCNNFNFVETLWEKKVSHFEGFKGVVGDIQLTQPTIKLTKKALMQQPGSKKQELFVWFCCFGWCMLWSMNFINNFQTK